MIWNIWRVCALAVLLASPVVALAQDDCLEELAKEVPKNSMITVFGKDDSAESGLFLSVELTQRYVTLEQFIGQGGTARRTINYDAARVSRIVYQPGKGIGTTSLIGALVGAAVGVAVSLALADSGPGAYVPGLLLGAGLGGWIGYELQSDPDPAVFQCE